jgi:hypothetical protein
MHLWRGMSVKKRVKKLSLEDRDREKGRKREREREY